MTKRTYIRPQTHSVEFVSDVFMKHWSVAIYHDDPGIGTGDEGDIGVKMEINSRWSPNDLWAESW